MIVWRTMTLCIVLVELHLCPCHFLREQCSKSAPNSCFKESESIAVQHWKLFFSVWTLCSSQTLQSDTESQCTVNIKSWAWFPLSDYNSLRYAGFPFVGPKFVDTLELHQSEKKVSEGVFPSSQFHLMGHVSWAGVVQFSIVWCGLKDKWREHSKCAPEWDLLPDWGECQN